MQVGMATRSFRTRKTRSATSGTFRNELRLSNLAEPLGFDSIWGVEASLTDYTMCPDVMQSLTYMHQPHEKHITSSVRWWWCFHGTIHVAEEISMLDHVRGAPDPWHGARCGSPSSWKLRVPMDESRERFVEAAEMVLAGLDRDIANTQHYKQPRADIRPKPEKPSRAAPMRRRSLPVGGDHGAARHRHSGDSAEAVADGR